MGELHTIASNGNLNVVKKTLKRDKDAFLAIDEELGWSPLHYAANKSKTKVGTIEYIYNIIKKYIKINEK